MANARERVEALSAQPDGRQRLAQHYKELARLRRAHRRLKERLRLLAYINNRLAATQAMDASAEDIARKAADIAEDAFSGSHAAEMIRAAFRIEEDSEDIVP